ncbi:hypothetical protein MFLAVUS_010483 [Mucor flavus]|uniref:rRNA processing protein EBP2 n=1 Tax=Mucor flavus TaxID=439312 RepID=A0ABP9ZCT7_9FUNG
MSRKSDRLARKATKKVNTPTVEKVESAAESDEEEVPILEAEEEQIEQDSDVEEEENDDNEEQDSDEEVSVKKSRALRPRINNEDAMIRLTESFKLKGLPWIETMTITSTEPVVVEDVKDDMARELAFYQQALEAAKLGRELVKKAGVDFSRPEDYFAEMLKSDEHMAKIRQRLLDESASVKASEEAKRQRQLKKFGKKVQVEKQLERQKQKTEMLEKIKLLKRKRKDGGDLTLNDDFDVALDKADTNKRAKTETKPTKNHKRVAKDTKYGFGGKKRFAKSNTLESTSGLGGYNKMKGKPIYKGKGKVTASKKK